MCCERDGMRKIEGVFSSCTERIVFNAHATRWVKDHSHIHMLTTHTRTHTVEHVCIWMAINLLTDRIFVDVFIDAIFTSCHYTVSSTIKQKHSFSLNLHTKTLVAVVYWRICVARFNWICVRTNFADRVFVFVRCWIPRVRRVEWIAIIDWLHWITVRICEAKTKCSAIEIETTRTTHNGTKEEQRRAAAYV